MVIKMSKIKWYKLIFKQRSPMHIGKYRYGVISETELIIPGHTMWGALVNYYGTKSGGTSEMYDKEKGNLKNLTCFYPSFDPKGNDVFFPTYKSADLHYGDFTEEWFRNKITDTFISTSVEPVINAAKDSTLHEIETILPKDKYDKKQIFWVGLVGLILDDNNSNEFIQDEAFSYFEHYPEIIVGGDGRYGLGRLQLEDYCKSSTEELTEWQIDIDGRFINNRKAIKNYITVQDISLIEGEYKTVFQYNYGDSSNNPQLAPNKYYLCYLPGSEVKINNESVFHLEKGIFKKTIN